MAIRAPSARCEEGRQHPLARVFLRASVVVVSLVPLPVLAAPRAYWIEASPKGAAEAAIRDAISRSAFAGPHGASGALLALADAAPGTAPASLARVAAGLALVDAGRHEEALAVLRHPDVATSPLFDHALFGIARALEEKKDPVAGQAYLAVADALPEGPLACPALFRAAERLEAAVELAAAQAALQRALGSCAGQEARALLEIGALREKLRDPKAAAAAFDQLEREFPASPQRRAAEARLRALAAQLPPRTREERDARDIATALAIFESSQWSSAAAELRALKARPLAPADADRVRVKLGRAYLMQKRTREADAELRGIPADSPHSAEAAFYRARIAVARGGAPDGYESVAELFAGTPWAEEALLALANHYQKDARDDEALPYYRRLLLEHPNGRYADRAAWRVGWGDYRGGRHADAARTLEEVARRRPVTSYTAGMLYWAARAKQTLGDTAGARALFQEVVGRFKSSYHGQRAAEALLRVPRGPVPEPPPPVAPPDPSAHVPEPQLTRVRQLLLIERLDEAYAELGRLPASPIVQATRAFVESRRGRLRPAIVSMKRAYPEWVSEAGAGLPDDAWRILFPLEFDQLLRQKAAEEGLDPALVAGLICQESTFDAGAVSAAGARGLMQVIPPTGRALARQLGVRYRTSDLLNPGISLDFGTRYLRQLLERFGGRVERVLAAYNAGPHRVDAWTAGRPDISDEEFVESIPFSETRHYVMTVLANRQHYRRLYGLEAVETGVAQAGSR